jgi:hypothetical protein
MDLIERLKKAENLLASDYAYDQARTVREAAVWVVRAREIIEAFAPLTDEGSPARRLLEETK